MDGKGSPLSPAGGRPGAAGRQEEPEIEVGVSEDPAAAEDVVKALTAAITTIAADILQKTAKDNLQALIKPQIEQSLNAMVPALVENAVAAEKVLIKEIVQETTRQTLPGMVGPILDRLAQEIIRDEVRKLMGEAAKEIIEKIAWEVIPLQAETEVKKEIERLTAEP